jgi:hypothetical protein
MDGIVNRDDGLGSRGDGFFDAGFVNVEFVRPNIDKDWHAAAQHKGVGRGECETWHGWPKTWRRIWPIRRKSADTAAERNRGSGCGAGA